MNWFFKFNSFNFNCINFHKIYCYSLWKKSFSIFAVNCVNLDIHYCLHVLHKIIIIFFLLLPYWKVTVAGHITTTVDNSCTWQICQKKMSEPGRSDISILPKKFQPPIVTATKYSWLFQPWSWFCLTDLKICPPPPPPLPEQLITFTRDDLRLAVEK